MAAGQIDTRDDARRDACRLYGRVEQLEALVRALDRGAGGIVVRGPLGAGKTTLLRAAIEQSRSCASTLIAHAWPTSMPTVIGPVQQLRAQLQDPSSGSRRGASRHSADADHGLATAIERHVAARGPVRVVVEDLHHCDVSSLEQLIDLVESAPSAPVIVTVRDDLPVDARRATLIAELVERSDLVDLPPLDVHDVEAWIDDLPPESSGRPAISAAAVLRETGGSPLLIHARLLEPPERFHARLVTSVRDRLSLLTPIERRMIEVLALLPDADRPTMRRVLGCSVAELELALGASSTRPLLDNDAGRIISTGVRRAIQDAMAPRVAAELHWHVARVLDDDALDDPSERDLDRLEVVAAHLYHSAAPCRSARVRAHLARTARRLQEGGRTRSAERALDQARALAARFAAPVSEQCDLLIELAAIQRSLGSSNAIETARQALSMAQRQPCPAMRARAILASTRSDLGTARVLGPDPGAVPGLQRALEELGADHPMLQVELSCALVVHGEAVLSLAERRHHLDRAVALAQTLAQTLEESPDGAVRLRLAERSMGAEPLITVDPDHAAADPLSTDLRAGCLIEHALALLHSGRIAELAAYLDTLIIDEVQAPLLGWLIARFRATVALSNNQLDAARVHAEQASRLATGTEFEFADRNDQRLRSASARGEVAGASIHGEWPRPVELRHGVGTTGRRGPSPIVDPMARVPRRAFRAAALAWVEPGRARELMESVLRVGSNLFGTRHLVPTFAAVAHCAVQLGDTRAAARAVEVLVPHQCGMVVLGNGAVVAGSVADALRPAARMIGAEHSVFRRASPANELRRIDNGWQLRFAGAECVLPALTGVESIARLLRTPGIGVPVEVLVGDEAIFVQYCAAVRRLQDLQLERDDAEAHGDSDRQADVDASIHELVTLVAALGVDNHVADPRMHHQQEKTRMRVGKGIRTALSRVEAIDPDAASALRRGIETGRLCRYTGSDRWLVHAGEPSQP